MISMNKVKLKNVFSCCFFSLKVELLGLNIFCDALIIIIKFFHGLQKYPLIILSGLGGLEIEEDTIECRDDGKENVRLATGGKFKGLCSLLISSPTI